MSRLKLREKPTLPAELKFAFGHQPHHVEDTRIPYLTDPLSKRIKPVHARISPIYAHLT
jgi:hypothetical protein